MNSRLTRLQEYILCFLLNRKSYAVEIRNVIFELSNGEIFPGDGTLHPALCKLEEGGFVRSEMIKVNLELRGGNRRKMYTITLNGRARLHQEEMLRERLTSWSNTNDLES